MRLWLHSGGRYAEAVEEVLDFLGPVRQIQFVPYALHDLDAYVAKVNALGTALWYCGYIGGSKTDSVIGISVDGAGNACVTGRTDSDQTSFPVTGGPGVSYDGGEGAVVVEKQDRCAAGETLAQRLAV